VNIIRSDPKDTRVSDLYIILKSKMSHKTIDKHIDELIENGYLFKFIRSRSDHEHLEIDSNRIYVSMVEKKPELKLKLIKENPFFPFVLASEKKDFGDALAIDCPECGNKGIKPTYNRTFHHYTKGHPLTMVETIKWECPNCSFKHKNSMKSYVAF
jgi:hypothetical protein